MGRIEFDQNKKTVGTRQSLDLERMRHLFQVLLGSF